MVVGQRAVRRGVMWGAGLWRVCMGERAGARAGRACARILLLLLRLITAYDAIHCHGG